MPITFPKNKNPFDWPPSFYKKIEKQGYNHEHLDYSGVLFYMSSPVSKSYSFEALIFKSQLEVLGSAIYNSFNPELSDQFASTLPKSLFKPKADLKSAFNSLNEVGHRVDEVANFRLKAVCNSVPGIISPGKTRGAIKLELVQIGTNFILYFYLPYERVDVDQPDQEYAMIVGTSHIWSAAYLIKNSYVLTNESNKNVIRKIYAFLFKDAGTDRNKLDIIYYWAPEFIINERSENELLSDMDSLLQGFVDEIGTNEEEAILKMLNSLTSPARLGNEISAGNAKATEILSKLIDTKKLYKLPSNSVESIELDNPEDGTSIFAALYYKMNDYGGNNNFTTFINQLYALWLLSEWPLISTYPVGYTSEKSLGFYFTSHNFIFYEGEKYIKVFPVGNNQASMRRILLKEEISLHVFAPVSITGDAEIDVAEQDAVSSFMPAFYLKGIDDKNATANLETGLFLAVDIVSTFTGFGNLLKFTKLLKLMKMTEGAFTLSKGLVITKTIIAGIELSSGVVGAMITLSNNCNSKFCNALRNCLFYLELLSLGADVVVTKLLKKSAQKALEVKAFTPNKGVDETAFKEMIETLEGLAGATIKIPNNLTRIKAYEKWAKKFDKNLVNHLTGDVGIKLITENGKQFYKLTNKGQGGHVYSQFIEIKEFLIPPGIARINNVPIDTPFKCKINIKSKYGQKFVKSAPSSIFPRNWDIKRIREEIALVYENTVVKGNGLNPDSVTKNFKQYKFKDGSGSFDILIEVDDNLNIINAYPLI